MTVNELQRIRQWHVEHRVEHPLEYHAWDLALTVWVLGWVSWFPLCAFGPAWTAPVSLLGIRAPGLYVAWRHRAHRSRTLRCDWLDAGRDSAASAGPRPR